METVGQETGKIETRLRQLGARLDRLSATIDAAGADANEAFRRQIEDAKSKRDVVHGKLQAFRAANGQKWDNFRGGVETAWRDFADAFKALKQ
jgi:hypothetical protein